MMKLNIVYLSGEMSPILLKPGERRLMVPMNDDVVASGEMAEIKGDIKCLITGRVAEKPTWFMACEGAATGDAVGKAT